MFLCQVQKMDEPVLDWLDVRDHLSFCWQSFQQLILQVPKKPESQSIKCLHSPLNYIFHSLMDNQDLYVSVVKLYVKAKIRKKAVMKSTGSSTSLCTFTPCPVGKPSSPQPQFSTMLHGLMDNLNRFVIQVLHGFEPINRMANLSRKQEALWHWDAFLNN